MKYRGTKDPLGFCIPGMCIYDLASDKVLKLDKHYGRSLNCDSVRDGNFIPFKENLNKNCANHLKTKLFYYTSTGKTFQPIYLYKSFGKICLYFLVRR